MTDTPLGRRGSYLTIWHEPTTDGQYVAAADTSTGRAAAASCCYVADSKTGEQVAALWGFWPSTVFADKLHELVQKYNEAFLCVESNMGETVLVRLLDTWGYSNLYFDIQLLGRVESKRTARKPGLTMSDPIRRHALSHLAEDLANGSIIIHDVPFFDEAATFHVSQTPTGREKPKAIAGKRDDRVMTAAMLSLMLRQWPYEPPPPPRKIKTPDDIHWDNMRRQTAAKQRLQKTYEGDDRMADVFTHMRQDPLDADEAMQGLEYD